MGRGRGSVYCTRTRLEAAEAPAPTGPVQVRVAQMDGRGHGAVWGAGGDSGAAGQQRVSGGVAELDEELAGVADGDAVEGLLVAQGRYQVLQAPVLGLHRYGRMLHG